MDTKLIKIIIMVKHNKFVYLCTCFFSSSEEEVFLLGFPPFPFLILGGGGMSII